MARAHRASWARKSSVLIFSSRVRPCSSPRAFQHPMYQNFPCEFDSLGEWPNISTAKATSNSNPNAARANVASTAKPNKGELRVGMTTDEVKALLGEPEQMVDDEPSEGGRVSLWRY